MKHTITNRTGWLLLGALILAMLTFVACSSGDDDGGDSGAAQAPTQVSVAPKVDRLVFGITPPGGEGSSPARDYSSPDSFQLRPMYDWIVEADPKTGEFIPGLATGWSIEPDGKSVRFKLREGIQFHNGWGEFTARDIVHNHADISAEDATNGYTRFFRAIVEEFEIVNDYEVIYRNKFPDADFINALSAYEGAGQVTSKAHFDQAGKPTLVDEPIAGTGPYKFMAREQGRFVRFERVDTPHWESTPDFPELELRWVPEASTRLATLLAGEVHITQVPTDLIPTATAAGMKVLKGPTPVLRSFLSIYCCYIDPQTEEYRFTDSPLFDVNVRKALNKAVNRDELNEAFFGGEAELMYLTHYHPTRPGWNPQWKQRFPEAYGYDPDAARAILAEAGYSASNPLETNIFTVDNVWYSGAADIAESIASYWRDIGVKVNEVNMESGLIRAARRAYNLKNDSRVWGTTANMALSLKVYNTTQIGSSGTVHHPTTETLFDILVRELDTTKQDALYREFGDLAYDLYQHVPLFWVPVEIMINPDIVGEYDWCGCVAGNWSHFGNLRTAR